ncbi:hypothetical protein DB30_01431 [Enhygromyxa salina]|uniref:Uncharacterized protein n=1 Tax=Enhygromyxa salina TaxID=215803 RepID=A0A0C2DFC5_9BACT|nr:hypothetical protein DB30_01431 [Enhygromyxa salina]
MNGESRRTNFLHDELQTIDQPSEASDPRSANRATREARRRRSTAERWPQLPRQEPADGAPSDGRSCPDKSPQMERR